MEQQHELCLISNPIENSKDRVKGLNSMRKKGLFCDLNIIVQGSKFTVHKSMMATASEYLFNLLKQQDVSMDRKDGKTTVELNKQITVRGFEPLVEFVYTGVLSVKHDQVLEVLSASSFLQMFNVSAKIQAYCNQVLQGSQQRGAASHPFAQPHIAHMLARILGQNFMQQPPSVQRMTPLLSPHTITGLPDASAFAAVLNEKFMPSNLANIQNSIRMDQAAANNQHKITSSHDTLGLEQMIDPVQLQQMRQYAAGIRVNDVKSRVGQQQQQQQRIQQSQNTKPVSPPHHKPSREPKGQYADKIKSLTMSNNNIMMSSSTSPVVMATHHEASQRPSSADVVTAKKQKMSMDMNRDRSDLADAKIRLKRNRSFDTPLRKQEVNAETVTSHNLNSNNNNNNSNNGTTLEAPDSTPLRRKSRDSSSDFAAVDDDSKKEEAATTVEKAPTATPVVDENSNVDGGVQYQQEHHGTTEASASDMPSCSYNQSRSKTPQKQQQQRNGQLMALLQPGDSDKPCSKSGKAMVDEFANNVLNQQQEGYRHLLEHFSGDNVIQYLSHQQQQRPHISQPSWMHVGSKQIFQAIKAQNQSPNGSTSQREVDLPKLPPSGRYSTVRRRTLQSNKPKPFKCKICHSTFTRYHNLKQHVKLHSGIKPYTCHICSKSFTRNYTLKLHRAKHFAKGGSTLRCQMCPASFDDPSTYDTHIRMSHAQLNQYRERSVSNEEELGLDTSDYVSERERSDSQSSYKANGGYSSPSSQEGDAGNYKNYYIKQEVNTKDSYKSMHSKVRYGLDSPGGSSGDGMMNGSNSSPSESPSYRGESDDMPTDLSVMKKGSDDAEDEEEEELMIAENDHQSNNQQQGNIKQEMQRGIVANGQ